METPTGTTIHIPPIPPETLQEPAPVTQTVIVQSAPPETPVAPPVTREELETLRAELLSLRAMLEADRERTASLPEEEDAETVEVIDLPSSELEPLTEIPDAPRPLWHSLFAPGA